MAGGEAVVTVGGSGVRHRRKLRRLGQKSKSLISDWLKFVRELVPWQRQLFLLSLLLILVVAVLLPTKYQGTIRALGVFIIAAAVGLIVSHVAALIVALTKLLEVRSSVLGWIGRVKPELKQYLDLNLGIVRDREDYWFKVDMILGHLGPRLTILQWSLVTVWVLHLIAVVALSSVIVATLDVGNNWVFENLNASEGFLGPLYYTVVTMATIGYGDVFPNGGVGQVFVIASAGLTIVVLTMGVGFVVNNFYALPTQLRYEVDAGLGGLP